LSVKAVTFDLWNTLLCAKNYEEPRVSVLSTILEEDGFSMDKDKIRSAYESAIIHFDNLWKKDTKYHVISAAKSTAFILRELNTRLPRSSVKRIINEFEEVILHDPPLLVEDVKMVLKKLDKQYRIGLISNSGITPGRILRKVLDKLEVLRYLDCTVFSDEIGYTKPHQLIFREAVKILQSNPHETAHIGDLLHTDVAGAKSFGMKTLWLNKAGDVNKSDIKPDYEVRRLSQIIEILSITKNQHLHLSQLPKLTSSA
jgi:putative hydrolase of the HAD superfamily